MAATGDQVAALRAYLSVRTDAETTDAQRQFITLSRTGRLGAVGALVYGAFAAAARRRFSPTWASADIVRFAADFRSSSAEAADLLSPAAAETSYARSWATSSQSARPKKHEPARSSCCSPRSRSPWTRTNWMTCWPRAAHWPTH